jgi:hypothetical protein
MGTRGKGELILRIVCKCMRLIIPYNVGKAEAESKEKHCVWESGPYARVDFNLTLCPLQRVDSNTFTMGNPMPEATLTLCQSRLYPPVRDLGLASGVE